MSLEPTHQQRFDRAIYLYYVETRQDNDFKHVSKEDFYRLLEKDLQTAITDTFNKTRIWRLADEKIKWLDKYRRVIGEVWKEDDIESYWILKKYTN